MDENVHHVESLKDNLADGSIDFLCWVGVYIADSVSAHAEKYLDS